MKESIRPGEAAAVDPENPWGRSPMEALLPVLRWGRKLRASMADYHLGSPFSPEQAAQIQEARGITPTAIIIDELSAEEIQARRAS